MPSTRVFDAMIDVIFTTATDVEQANQITALDAKGDEASVPSKERVKGTWEFTDRNSTPGETRIHYQRALKDHQRQSHS